ncbi:helix-turn-helix domain-containing protein [Desmospora profundinema]|uniref:Cytoskeletal protein RodZ n=1 Tax=Desmospora profundinema TaxID=1571184 RepID=A0ABU1IHK7_9BACL|nr:RodZ domain-containing protein [Desmospora profundinema]MDR6224250.1 cytoskeletal protein RodZ [Desmospora profundinema]
MATGMSNPTDQLRAARERAGLSLEDVQQQTKIQVRYLEAIERGDFQRLPGSFYGRAFIRSYAEYLGVQPMPLLKYYDQMTQTASDEGEEETAPLPSISRRQRYAQKAGRKRAKGFSLPFTFSRSYAWLLLVVFILLIPTVIYAFHVFGNEGGEEEETSGQKVQAAPQDQEDSEANVQLVQAAETYEFGDVFEITNAEQVEVTLEAKGNTWFRYRAGGPKEAVTEEADLAAGETKTFEHPEWISLLIQNPDLVQLRVNDYVIDTSETKKSQAYQLKLKR